MSRLEHATSTSIGDDLVPGADPYIVSLMAKLRRSGGRLLSDNPQGQVKCRRPGKSRFQSERGAGSTRNEATPPLETEDPDGGSPYFGDDWSGRGAWRPE